jgi:LPXTG-motif cell wall-anchored protein
MGLRRSAASMVLAALVAAGALVAGTGAASAQTTNFCQFIVNPVAVQPPGGTINVSGTAPADGNVRVFANGTLMAEARSNAVTGAFSASFFVARTSEITVAIDDYPATGCGLNPAQANALRNVNRSLARTGGSGIGTNLLIGAAMVAVGAVIVVAVRRRNTLFDSPKSG